MTSTRTIHTITAAEASAMSAWIEQGGYLIGADSGARIYHLTKAPEGDYEVDEALGLERSAALYLRDRLGWTPDMGDEALLAAVSELRAYFDSLLGEGNLHHRPEGGCVMDAPRLTKEQAAHVRNWYFEVELDGRVCPKCIRQSERPSPEDARRHFEGLGYAVGYIKGL